MHTSRTYLQTPTQSSAVYVIQCLFLHRHYQEAMRVVSHNPPNKDFWKPLS